MNVFDAAQPALLYIVPAVLGAVAAHAAGRGEVGEVLAHSEEAEEGGEATKAKSPARAKKVA